jgi:hypothetical protein
MPNISAFRLIGSSAINVSDHREYRQVRAQAAEHRKGKAEHKANQPSNVLGHVGPFDELRLSFMSA